MLLSEQNLKGRIKLACCKYFIKGTNVVSILFVMTILQACNNADIPKPAPGEVKNSTSKNEDVMAPTTTNVASPNVTKEISKRVEKITDKDENNSADNVAQEQAGNDKMLLLPLKDEKILDLLRAPYSSKNYALLKKTPKEKMLAVIAYALGNPESMCGKQALSYFKNYLLPDKSSPDARIIPYIVSYLYRPKGRDLFMALIVVRNFDDSRLVKPLIESALDCTYYKKREYPVPICDSSFGEAANILYKLTEGQIGFRERATYVKDETRLKLIKEWRKWWVENSATWGKVHPLKPLKDDNILKLLQFRAYSKNKILLQDIPRNKILSVLAYALGDPDSNDGSAAIAYLHSHEAIVNSQLVPYLASYISRAKGKKLRDAIYLCKRFNDPRLIEPLIEYALVNAYTEDRKNIPQKIYPVFIASRNVLYDLTKGLIGSKQREYFNNETRLRLIKEWKQWWKDNGEEWQKEQGIAE